VVIYISKIQLIVFGLANIALGLWLFYGVLLVNRWLKEVLGINEILNKNK
jgi:uncharacterized protein with PQ loop repeat